MYTDQTRFKEIQPVSTVFRIDERMPEVKSVLLISESKQLESLLEGVLDTIEAKVVKSQPTIHAWRSITMLQPKGLIVDLDMGAGAGYNFLCELNQTKHALKFVAATSSDPLLEKTALDCGADIFFENAIRPVIHLFSFFVATLGKESRNYDHLDQVSRVRADLFEEYMSAYKRLRSSRTDESFLDTVRQIERLAWKNGDHNLLRATAHAARTGSTVWLSAYFQKCLGVNEYRAISSQGN